MLYMKLQSLHKTIFLISIASLRLGFFVVSRLTSLFEAAADLSLKDA